MISIDLMVTSKCNLSCPFCYGSDQSTLETSITDKYKIVDVIHEICPDALLVISGGEPTMYSDICNLCKYAHSLGFSIALQTNATNHKIYKTLLKYLKWICFPLDGVSAHVCSKMRQTELHYKHTIDAIKHVSEYRLKHSTTLPKIKIGTVITSLNYHELDSIYKAIESTQIDVWKIYKLRKRGKSANIKMYNALKCSAVNIEQFIENIKPQFNIYYSQEEANDSYLIIEPDSEVKVIKGRDCISYGYIIQNNKTNNSTLYNALNYMNLENASTNIRNSFLM